ncbi:MAG: hypothetical protein CH6_0099 [Candidatus Kapaibacterium sp.]|nr:MAG: hypothetical protein CH6_0099 [Candidatus Kapabacteria bacterium]
MENFEIIQPFFSTSLNVNYTIYRSRVDKERFYFAMYNGSLLKLPSVTTILANTLPMEEWLVRWIAHWGYEQAIERRNQAAHYGILFSMIVADFIRSKQIDLSTIEARVATYRYANNINFPTDFWVQRLKEDLFSLACFIHDYSFEPIAVELPLVSTKYKFAGTIDAIGWMSIGSGVNGKKLKRDSQTQRVLAIIDWKTGRHGFYRSHEAQLHFYRLLVEENFPELTQTPIKLFNWAPKEWTSESDSKYSLKDQTQSKEAFRILNYLAIYQVDDSIKNHTFKVFDGVLKLNSDNSDRVKFVDYADLIRNKFSPQNSIVQENEVPENGTVKKDIQISDVSNEEMTAVEVASDVLSELDSFFQQLKEEA